MSTLTEQFLAWVADRPRTYAEAMEAWRYEPARLNGMPIDSQSSTNFDFRLS